MSSNNSNNSPSVSPFANEKAGFADAHKTGGRRTRRRTNGGRRTRQSRRSTNGGRRTRRSTRRSTNGGKRRKSHGKKSRGKKSRRHSRKN